MLDNIKSLYLHRVFHGIRFKVNNEDWLSVRIAFFYVRIADTKHGPLSYLSSCIITQYIFSQSPKPAPAGFIFTNYPKKIAFLCYKIQLYTFSL